MLETRKAYKEVKKAQRAAIKREEEKGEAAKAKALSEKLGVSEKSARLYIKKEEHKARMQKSLKAMGKSIGKGVEFMSKQAEKAHEGERKTAAKKRRTPTKKTATTKKVVSRKKTVKKAPVKRRTTRERSSPMDMGYYT